MIWRVAKNGFFLAVGLAVILFVVNYMVSQYDNQVGGGSYTPELNMPITGPTSGDTPCLAGSARLGHSGCQDITVPLLGEEYWYAQYGIGDTTPGLLG